MPYKACARIESVCARTLDTCWQCNFSAFNCTVSSLYDCGQWKNCDKFPSKFTGFFFLNNEFDTFKIRSTIIKEKNISFLAVFCIFVHKYICEFFALLLFSI